MDDRALITDAYGKPVEQRFTVFFGSYTEAGPWRRDAYTVGGGPRRPGRTRWSRLRSRSHLLAQPAQQPLCEVDRAPRSRLGLADPGRPAATSLLHQLYNACAALGEGKSDFAMIVPIAPAGGGRSLRRRAQLLA